MAETTIADVIVKLGADFSEFQSESKNASKAMLEMLSGLKELAVAGAEFAGIGDGGGAARFCALIRRISEKNDLPWLGAFGGVQCAALFSGLGASGGALLSSGPGAGRAG